uniref:Calx-beta domain-containing protein n=1 Tax=Amphimedon queenslandica TaxID=400682 RepID=A0A1X7STV4_AMPQE
RGTYDVIENEGTVEICAVLTGGVLSTDTEITLQARDNTARFRSDYSTRGVRPTLPAFSNRTCGRFNIINDTISEPLFENFTVLITGISPENSELTIDQTLSFIRIQDDDLAVIGFERDTYSFLENAGTTMVVTVVLSNEVVRPFTVRVVGDPGPMTPGNSGTPVNQVLGFAANDNSSANLRQIVPVTIVDDSISGEAVQTYPLNFTDVPQGITIGSFRSTNIVIIDDDESVVRIVDGDKTVLESDGSSVITVVLTGANSDIVSVDVLNSTSGVVGTATFLSSQDVTTQTFNITVNYLDDSVALEPNEIFTYTLGNLRGEARIGMSNTSTHTLVDDDRLTVQFNERMYTFNEPDGAVSIAVNISNPIAQGFTISTGRIIQTQPFVIRSGPSFSDPLVFTPTGPMTINVNGIVTDDIIALEDVEIYRVQLSNLNISSPYVTVGAPTNVRVISED